MKRRDALQTIGAATLFESLTLSSDGAQPIRTLPNTFSRNGLARFGFAPPPSPAPQAPGSPA